MTDEERNRLLSRLATIEGELTEIRIKEQILSKQVEEIRQRLDEQDEEKK